MTRHYKVYSETFRRQVVTEYEAGVGVMALRRKYGITGSGTITRWIKKYGREGYRNGTVHIQTTEEADRTRALEKRVKELEQALGQVTLEKLKLEGELEAQRDPEGIGLKKNAIWPSKRHGSKPGKAGKAE